MLRRKTHNECSDHALLLFRVFMRLEERARFVEEQLVRLGNDFLKAKSFCRISKKYIKETVPLRVDQLEL